MLSYSWQKGLLDLGGVVTGLSGLKLTRTNVTTLFLVLMVSYSLWQDSKWVLFVANGLVLTV